MAPHVAARSQENPTYPTRFAVPDASVPWSVAFPGYQPIKYVFLRKDASYADAADPKTIADLKDRFSHEGFAIDPASGAPLNPAGRTGMTDRGRLAKWGPNHAADPLVTRYHPETGELQLVVIKRKDTGAWALPGGMVDAGENVSATVRREFEEEAGNLQDPAAASRFRSMADALFGSGGSAVYKGYVDDPRNTDNAWMETVAMHFHCTPEMGRLLPLEAGDDAAKVKWVTVTPSLNLYASHREWVGLVETSMRRKALMRKAMLVALPVLLAAGVYVAAGKAKKA